MPIEQLVIADRLGGKGINENGGRGYQPAAKSDGLQQDCIDFLKNICPHYGQAVKVISSACNEATSWAQKEGDKPEEQRSRQIPDNVADKFPVSWNYTPLVDKKFAITRVCYAFSCENRPGSFMSHSLVVSPEMLEQLEYNPLVLTHSDLFWRNDQPDVIKLPSLETFSARNKVDGLYKVLTTPPIKDKLANIISALISEYPVTKPVVILLPDWKAGNAVCEALLDILPPTRRCRTGVSTFATDFKWAPGNMRSENRKSLHDLIILGKDDNQPSSIKAFDYQQNEYSIFNFAEDKFNEQPQACAYAVFAEKCLLEDNYAKLQKMQNLCEILNCVEDPAAMNSLIAADIIFNKQVTPSELVQILQVIQEKCNQPQQVRYVIELLDKFIKEYYNNNDHAGMAMVASGCGNLLQQMSLAEVMQLEFYTDMAKNIDDSISNGKWRMAEAVATLFGKEYKNILVESLFKCIEDSNLSVSCSKDSDDMSKMAEVIQYLYIFIDKNSDCKLSLDNLMIALCEAAQKAGCAGPFWKLIGASPVIPYLQDNFNEKKDLANSLLSIFQAVHVPEACTWLRYLQISNSTLEPEQLVQACVEVVDAGSCSSDCAEVIAKIPELIKNRIPQTNNQALALGMIAEHACMYSYLDFLFLRYQSIMNNLDPEMSEKVRNSLLEQQCIEVVSREIIENLNPWKATQKTTLAQWKKCILDSNSKILDKIYGELATQIHQNNLDAIILAEIVVPDELKNQNISNNLVRLLQEIALHLPIAPLDGKWSLVFVKLDEFSTFSKAAISRIEILKFMREMNISSSKSDWKIVKFPTSGSIWEKVKDLSSQDERAAAVKWSLGVFKNCGINNSAEAQHFINILKCAGIVSHGKVASFIFDLIKDRDLVTIILIISAFYDIDHNKNGAENLHIVNALKSKCANKTIVAFKQHLQRRFYYKNEKTMKKIEAIFPETKPKPESVTSKNNDPAHKSGKTIRSMLRNFIIGK
jgi:hypothetical protein